MAERIGQSVIDTVTHIWQSEGKGEVFQSRAICNNAHRALSAGKGHNESYVQIGDLLFGNEQ